MSLVGELFLDRRYLIGQTAEEGPRVRTTICTPSLSSGATTDPPSSWRFFKYVLCELDILTVKVNFTRDVGRSTRRPDSTVVKN